MIHPVLKTQRLTLRPINANDQLMVFKGFSHPDVIKYFDITYSTYESVSEQMDWYRNSFENGVGYAWVISNDSNLFMGIFTIHRIDKNNKKGELGYWLFPEHWKKGYAAESLTKILEFAQLELRLHRISAEIEPENTDSILLLSRLGFEREGVFKDYEFKNGKFNSLETWAKLFPDN